MLQHFPVGWKLAGFGEGNGVRDALLLTCFDRFAQRGRQHVADDLEVVALDLGVELLVRPVLMDAILPGANMVAPTVGHALEEAWATTTADGSYRRPYTLMQLHRLVILDQLGLDAIGAGTGAQAGAGQAIFDVRIDGVEVVLAHEQDRQLLQRGKVDALVESAFVDGAFTKEAGDDRW